MLYAVKPPSCEIIKVTSSDGTLVLHSDYKKIFLTPVSERCIKVSVTREDNLSGLKRPGVVKKPDFKDWDYTESDEKIIFNSGSVMLEICRKTGSFTWKTSGGKLLVREPEKDGVILEKFEKYRMTEAATERVSTADGEKEVVREAKRVPDGYSYHAEQRFIFRDGEALYGLGQHEEGWGNLRGKTVYGHQANRKIALPFLVSNMGWGLLVDTYSPFIFSDGGINSYFYSEAVPELEYYFINGGDMRGAVAEYRGLTGGLSLLPKWAFGYIQSQERYETQDEIISVAKEYRRRSIGLDGIVLDWCSWEDGKWGQKSFDRTRFPDPGRMINELHDIDVKFMISVWANSDPGCENYEEFKEKGLFLPGQNIYNALSEAGRKTYWAQLERGLYKYGVDAWWCDNSEPITPEWQRRERPEPSNMYNEYVRTVSDHLPIELSNSFGLYHAQGVYEGQRSVSDEKRVFNLTRSASVGSQRFGTVLWSGDIEATWDTLTRQIGAGLGFSASGQPFWTTDIGAFFVKRGDSWFWRGDFDGGFSDLGYRELFTRWYQWEAFLPIFRGHGTDFRRELWLCENSDGADFFDAIIKANRLRYELLPYIYSEAGKCRIYGGSMIEFLAFEWPFDPEILNITDQYLFGSEMMVCPVHEPMYYLPGSIKIDVPKTRKVYFPETPGGWYAYGTGEHYSPGWAEVSCPIDSIPVFVKAGAVIPASVPAESTAKLSERPIYNVYPGAQRDYIFYEDSGDGYGYEKGEYRLSRVSYDEEIKIKVIHDGLK